MRSEPLGCPPWSRPFPEFSSPPRRQSSSISMEINEIDFDGKTLKRGYFSSQYLRLYHFGFSTIDVYLKQVYLVQLSWPES